jgi:diguanylate cyclase (GGDEF)-like protein
VFWLEILLRLRDGLIYGIGGYMFYVLSLLMIGLPLRFRDNLIGLPVVMLAPNLAAVAGLVPGFPYAKYNVLIVPACGLALFTLWAFDRLYRRAFDYQRSVERMAGEDALTGLANRRHFMVVGAQMVEAVRRYGRPAGLLILDLDHFKDINDHHGHAAGDIVLQSVAALLHDHRRGADLAARIGGEELAMLLAETDLPGAVAFAERLRVALELARIRLPGVEADVTITMSVGVAAFMPADGSLDAVLRRADAALYRAKNAGRNRVES